MRKPLPRALALLLAGAVWISFFALWVGVAYWIHPFLGGVVLVLFLLGTFQR